MPNSETPGLGETRPHKRCRMTTLPDSGTEDDLDDFHGGNANDGNNGDGDETSSWGENHDNESDGCPDGSGTPTGTDRQAMNSTAFISCIVPLIFDSPRPSKPLSDSIPDSRSKSLPVPQNQSFDATTTTTTCCTTSSCYTTSNLSSTGSTTAESHTSGNRQRQWASRYRCCRTQTQW